MIGRDHEQSQKVAVSIGGRPPGLRDAKRVNGVDPLGRFHADDLLPLQALVLVAGVSIVARVRLLGVVHPVMAQLVPQYGTNALLHKSLFSTATRSPSSLAAGLGDDDRYRYLIRDRDRDSIFAKGLDTSIAGLGLRVIRSPPHSPKANAICGQSWESGSSTTMRRVRTRRSVRGFRTHEYFWRALPA